MESALAWIGKFVEYISSWIPRPFIVKSIQRGVRFRYGKYALPIEPGVHVYVPLVTDIEIMIVVPQALEFKPTVLMTKDRKAISIGFTMLYEIVDIVKAVTSTDLINQTIGEIGESMLAPLVLSATLDDIVDAIASDADDGTSLNDQLTQSAGEILADYGVKVITCRINHIAPARVLYLLNNQSSQ